MLKIFVVCVASLAFCDAFKQGAPIEACGKRIPRHDNTVPTHNDGKYSFTYKPVGNSKYQIVLDGKGTSFKGFMIQALNSRNETIGQFQGDKENIQIIRECNSATHYNARPKNKVTLIWSGPGQDVHFWATAVQSYSRITIDMLAHPEDNRRPAAPLAPARGPHPSVGRPHPSARQPVHREPEPLYYPYEEEPVYNTDRYPYYE